MILWIQGECVKDKTILSLMPFFFDEKGISISSEYNVTDNIYTCTVKIIYEKEYDYVLIIETSRQEALIKACEKSFSILEKE